MSNFTWHFFHDSNWYDVNYEFVNSYALDNFEFIWGKGMNCVLHNAIILFHQHVHIDEGCGIITGDCNNAEVYPYNCPELDTDSCTPERLGSVRCLQ